MHTRFICRRDFNFAKYDTPSREVRDPASITRQPSRREGKKKKERRKKRRERAQSLKLLPDGGEPFLKHAASSRGRSFLSFRASLSRGERKAATTRLISLYCRRQRARYTLLLHVRHLGRLCARARGMSHQFYRNLSGGGNFPLFSPPRQTTRT
jgi:hypothetical protein